MRVTRLIAVVSAAVAVAASTAAGAATRVKATVVASHLSAPKHLLYTARGVYVDESGTGGPQGASNCVTALGTSGPVKTPWCVGRTGAIALVTGTHTKVLDKGLASVIQEVSGEVSGPSAFTVSSGGKISVLYQDALVGATGANGLPTAAARNFGTFQISPRVRVDLARYAATHPQAAATVGGTPGETVYDSDPYDVVAYRSGYAITDAAANALLYVTKSGHISLLARLPTQLETAPAGVLGSSPVPIHAQAVPTSVAVGPDGALYVGTLRGVPSLPGTAEIYRVARGHAPTVWASGLTSVTALAFDAKGRLLATELSTGGLLAPATTPGALVRISANGKHVAKLPVSGLFDPTGVTVSPTGTVWVANRGTSPGSGAHPGELLRITGLG